MQPQRLGPYRIERKLGRGGMGTVYAGVDEQTGKRAAIKVLAPSLAVDEGFRQRFEAEIDSLKRLTHPSIVQLFGYGEQQDRLFYAMQWIDGPSLEDELVAGRRFSWREVVSLGIQIAKAIKHAHDHGIIHRDIKPGNLLLIDDPNDPMVKLSDFGIARLFGNRLTGVGGVVGTAQYMAPEQADGQSVTHRCDQYSLGCVLYALLAGRPPFHAETIAAVLHMHLYSSPEPVGELASETPRELEKLIERLLSKDPADRFADAMVVARKLADVRDQHSLDGRLAETPVATGESQNKRDPQPATTHGDDLPPDGMLDDSSLAEITPSLSEQHGDSEQSDPVQQGDQPRVAERRRADQFTSVEHLGEEPAGESNLRRLLAPQTLLLLLALGGLIAGIAWLARGPSAETLMEQIETAAASDDPDRLLSVETDISRLRGKLPSGDPRLERLDALDEVIAIFRLDKRIRRWLSGTQRRASLSVVERAYADAVRLSTSDPRRGAEAMETLVELYGTPDEPSDVARRCVALARRELAQLAPLIEQQNADQRAMLRERLRRAEQLAKGDRPAARAIWQTIVRRFEEYPWAAAFVDQAERALKAEP